MWNRSIQVAADSMASAIEDSPSTDGWSGRSGWCCLNVAAIETWSFSSWFTSLATKANKAPKGSKKVTFLCRASNNLRTPRQCLQILWRTVWMERPPFNLEVNKVPGLENLICLKKKKTEIFPLLNNCLFESFLENLNVWSCFHNFQTNCLVGIQWLEKKSCCVCHAPLGLEGHRFLRGASPVVVEAVLELRFKAGRSTCNVWVIMTTTWNACLLISNAI